MHSNQKDLQIQTVWDNMWGVVQLVFLPDDKVMTVHKTGELRIYPSIFAKNTVSDDSPTYALMHEGPV